MQAGTSFKLTVRTHLPLTQTLASQQAALPSAFSRAVFLFDYADSELLHSLESTFRAVNAQCLGLHKSPGALAARAKAASVAGSASTDAGMVRLVCNAAFAIWQNGLPSLPRPYKCVAASYRLGLPACFELTCADTAHCTRFLA